MSTWPDILGLIGVFMVLMAYGLQQMRRIDGNGVLYPSLNLIGAILILISLAYKPNVPAIVMEAAWVAMSVVGIFLAVKARRNQDK
jgi:drug/metabolite transporter (DMT)-like permease